MILSFTFKTSKVSIIHIQDKQSSWLSFGLEVRLAVRVRVRLIDHKFNSLGLIMTIFNLCAQLQDENQSLRIIHDDICFQRKIILKTALLIKLIECNNLIMQNTEFNLENNHNDNHIILFIVEFGP